MRVPQVHVQPRLLREARKRLMLAHNRRFERYPIVPAVRQAADTLTPVSALTCTCRVVASGENHLIPEERRG